MDVVSAELYCVHSMMEYIRTKLHDTMMEKYINRSDIIYEQIMAVKVTP